VTPRETQLGPSDPDPSDGIGLRRKREGNASCPRTEILSTAVDRGYRSPAAINHRHTHTHTHVYMCVHKHKTGLRSQSSGDPTARLTLEISGVLNAEDRIVRYKILRPRPRGPPFRRER